MRLLILALAAIMAIGDLTWAQDQDFLADMILEEEASDVEVCQDFICSKLREEILIAADKCRPLASFKRRKKRMSRRRASNSCKIFRDENFRLSKGKCSAAIREACAATGIDARYLADNAYNLHKKGLLEKAGFVNMIWKYNEVTAPLGSILIYVGGAGHRYGHVEVRVNPNLYCSDHCNTNAVTGINANLQQKYKLVGVYLPFTSSIQVTTTNEPDPAVN